MSWLTYRPGVKTTPAITRAVGLLDRYFIEESSEITSGLRMPMDQLRIIMEKAQNHEIDNDFKEFKQPHTDELIMRPPELKVMVDGQSLYWWARTWSRLLSIGDIVNPPIATPVLCDYFRPGSLENKKGQVIQISPHMRGLAFDIAGNSNLTEKAKRVMKGLQSGECFMQGFLVEHINNAVHVDVVQIG